MRIKWIVGNVPSQMWPQNIERVLAFLGRKVLFYLALSVGVGIGASLVEMLFAYSIQALLIAMKVMPRSAAGLPDWVPVDTTGNVLLLVMVVGVLRTVFQWAYVMLRGFCFESTKQLQRKRILHWVYMSENVSSSRAMSLFSEFVHAASIVVMSLQTLAVRLTTAVFMLLAMAKLAPVTTAWVLLVLFVTAIPIRALNRLVYKLSVSLKKDWEVTSALLIRSIRNLILIRIYGTQKLEEKKALDCLERTGNNLQRFHVLSGLINSVPNLAGMALICFIVLQSESSPELKAGVLMSYLYLLVRISQLAADLSTQFSYVLINRPQTKALYDWWTTTAEFEKKFHGTGVVGARVNLPGAGAIGWEVKNLHFSYPGDSAVLKDLSFQIKPGTLFLVQGPSGSGKSTLLGILLGIIPSPGSGEEVSIVSADGTRASVLSAKDSLLRKIGYVGPDPFLIEGTIRENLLYGLLDEPKEADLVQALNDAQCDFVFQLRAGLDHCLTEQGLGLSAGQKQRISLARALLRRPMALIVDEGTANLDAVTEQKVIDTMMLLKNTTTLIVVSHRNTFAPVADQILQMENLGAQG